jgi:S-(hydroxymethyl)glutathione dehydrogenase/alcohol dehydrogenase
MNSTPSHVDSFKAAILTEVNKDLNIMNIHFPKVRYGQVLVKLSMAGICRSQLMEAKGKRGEDRFLPHMLGHEGVANVVEVGEGVTKVSVGQRVILGWLKGDGIDSGGSKLKSTDGLLINAGPVTTFSQYSLVSENRLTPCPEIISDEIAVLLGCALPTGAGMVLNQVKPDKDADVLLVGLGGIGLSALLMLNYFSPRTISVIDKCEKKLDIAKQLGATHCFKYDENVKDQVEKLFPSGYPFSIECAGTTQSIELAFELTSKQGNCVFASHPPNGEKIRLDPHQLICGKTIQGSWGGNCFPDTDLEIIGKYIQSLNIASELLVSHKFSLFEINKALNTMEDGDVTRVFIDFKLDMNYGN